MVDEGEGQGDEDREQGREQAHPEGVRESLEVDRIPEQFREIGQGDAPGRIEKRLPYRVPDRIHEKAGKERRGQGVNGDGEGTGHRNGSTPQGEERMRLENARRDCRKTRARFRRFRAGTVWREFAGSGIDSRPPDPLTWVHEASL